jgi:hypothetical protein
MNRYKVVEVTYQNGGKVWDLYERFWPVWEQNSRFGTKEEAINMCKRLNIRTKAKKCKRKTIYP